MFFSHTFRRLRNEEPAVARFGWYCVSILSGLIVPLLIILFGVLIYVLDGGRLTSNGLQLGDYLWVPIPDFLAAQPPLRQLTTVTATVFAIAAVLALLFWLHLRGLLSSIRNVLASLHAQLLDQIVQQSSAEGITAQRNRVDYLITKAMPAVHRGLMAWWRSIPRSILVLICCVVIAILVNVLLSILAVIGTLLLWRMYRFLQGDDSDTAARWELTRARRHLVELLDSAPLLERIQPRERVDVAYKKQLEALYEMQHVQDRRWARIMPLIALSGAIVMAAFVLALGVNLVTDDSTLKPASAFVLILSLAMGGNAVYRLNRILATVGPAVDAATAIYNVVDHRAAKPVGDRMAIPGIRESLRLEKVTLFNSHGQPLLADFSLTLKPKQLTALVGSSKESTLALVELLLGFGSPTSGRVEADGISIGDVHPRSLAKQFFWIGRFGPLWDGTIEENLRGDMNEIATADLREAIQEAGVYDALNALPEGLGTYITDDDPRLDEWSRYGIGVARAMVRQPALVVAQEPRNVDNEPARESTFRALRRLADLGSIVVFLPRQLMTLRSVDQIVVLHGPRLETIGKHGELLEKCDLYRHLNYMQFNPFRDNAESAV